jgi:hypothetical protein
MLPFTQPEFFAVFSRYNLAIWPVQVVAYALALTVLVALLLRARWAAGATFIVLAALWGWTGAVYHLGFFSAIVRRRLHPASDIVSALRSESPRRLWRAFPE